MLKSIWCQCSSYPEGLQTSPWRSCTTLLWKPQSWPPFFPSQYSFQSQKTHPLHPHPPPTLSCPMWHLWAITIMFSYKASQHRKQLYRRSQREFVNGQQERRDGCQGGLFISAWVDSYCGGDLPVRFGWCCSLCQPVRQLFPRLFTAWLNDGWLDSPHTRSTSNSQSFSRRHM